MQAHREAAVALLLDQLVVALVPDLDRAAAVLAGRDLALERRVGERMVLDVDGQVALALAQRDALGHGPALQGAAALDAEVVVQPAGVVALDDEDRLGAAALVRERLRRARRIALAAIGVQPRGHARGSAGRPSAPIGQLGLWATSHRWPSGSAK